MADSSKITLGQVVKLERDIKSIEDMIREMHFLPSIKLPQAVREIRELQNTIEREIKHISDNIELATVQIKFNYESAVYKYRAKQGIYEKQINEALFLRPGTFTAGTVQTKKVEEKKGGLDIKLKNQLSQVLDKLVDNDAKKEKYLDMIAKQINKAKEQAGKDMKVKVSLGKGDDGKPKIKIKLVKKDT